MFRETEVVQDMFRETGWFKVCFGRQGGSIYVKEDRGFKACFARQGWFTRVCLRRQVDQGMF